MEGEMQMRLGKKFLLSVAVGGTCFFGLSASRAANVTVPNSSFESPAGPFPLQVSLTIDNWTTNGPPDELVNVGAGPQNSGIGLFQNTNPGLSGFATNADGSNLVYMFSGYTGSDTNKLHTLSQVLSTTYAGNTAYTLTVGVSDAGSPPPTGDKLSLQLFYTAASDPTTPVILGTRNVVQGTDSLSATALTDYSVTVSGLDVPVLGRGIGILFTTTGAGGGEFNLDNVRLTAVPEPGTLALIGLGAAAVLVRRRRETR